MDNSLNIVDLIENNPITRLSNTYQNKLLIKIKENFNDSEQQMFVASFYCFLNYNQRNDFVIDLDDVWKWIGFNQKYNAKHMLEQNFMIDIDYKIIAPECSGAKNNNKILLNQKSEQTKPTRGGHNKETIKLTIRTFKLFCLKAGTKKAEQIHEYYIKLEETLQDVIQEESNEIKQQLEEKIIELQNTENEKEKIREKTILEQFSNNTQCVYYGMIDNVSDKNEKLIKFGNSNNLKNRVTKHKDTYENFKLINAFKVENKLQIENAIKEHVLFNERQRCITIKNKKYVELLNINGITYIELDKIIKEIITSIEYSPENYIKILNHNKLLRNQLDEKNDINNAHKVLLLTAENNRLTIENIKIIKRYNALKNKTKSACDDADKIITQVGQQENTINHIEIENYGNILHTCTNYTKRSKDGKYYLDGKIFDNLVGSRNDVWSGDTYKTTGGLIKKDLMEHRSGKIISKRKCIQETINNRFVKKELNKLPEEI